LDIVSLNQFDKESIMICHDNFVKILNLDGCVKKNILVFNFKIESLVLLAFHKHGLQKRSFKESDVLKGVLKNHRIIKLKTKNYFIIFRF
jgi:hypothetical protein